jgi:hypothetical protein
VAEQQYEYFDPPRRSWLGAQVRGLISLMGAAGIAVMTGLRAWRSAPFDVDYPQIEMPLRGLGKSFEGFRIVQFTDLHTGYRRRCGSCGRSSNRSTK